MNGNLKKKSPVLNCGVNYHVTETVGAPNLCAGAPSKVRPTLAWRPLSFFPL